MTRKALRLTRDGRLARKPGPVPLAEGGTRHAGMFKPGESGNPSGRPKKGPEIMELEKLARERAEDALQTMLEVMQDRDAPAAARLAAARDLLDRGFGKPIDRQAVLNLNPGGDGAELEKLDTRTLIRIAAGALREDRREARVIDIRPQPAENKGESGGEIDG